MTITSEQVIALHKEIIGLSSENVPIVSKYWLNKLGKELQNENNDLLGVYNNWKIQNTNKTFEEFLILNSEFNLLILNIKDIVFKKSDFLTIEISKYPIFNLIFTKI